MRRQYQVRPETKTKNSSRTMSSSVSPGCHSYSKYSCCSTPHRPPPPYSTVQHTLAWLHATDRSIQWFWWPHKGLWKRQENKRMRCHDGKKKKSKLLASPSRGQQHYLAKTETINSTFVRFSLMHDAWNEKIIVMVKLTLDLDQFNLNAVVFRQIFWFEAKRCQWAVETHWESGREEE